MNPINTNPMDEGQLKMGNPVDQSQMTSGSPLSSDQMSLGSQGNTGSMGNMGNMGSGGSQNQLDASADSQVQDALNPNQTGLDANDPNVAACPVCGTLVDKRTAQDTLASPVNQQMGTLYFDTARCKADFEQDPQRYGSTF